MNTNHRPGPFLPAFITFTGVDDATDAVELLSLADDYPVEFGLLFSPKRQGIEPRYPKLSTIDWLITELPLRWSAHLCGSDAREVIETGASRHDHLMQFFARAQINTADPNVRPSHIGNWAVGNNVRAILQSRGEAFLRAASVDVLFDASGGRGISPTSWPIAIKSTFCGFAGGLRPENVAEAVTAIARGAAHYWIDMESGVRDERDQFSIAKCRAVCEAVYGAPRGGLGDA